MGKLVEVIGKVMDLEGGVCFLLNFLTSVVMVGAGWVIGIVADCGFRALVLGCLGRWIGGILRIVVCPLFTPSTPPSIGDILTKCWIC